jgi:DNA-binding response OmpR family regulator
MSRLLIVDDEQDIRRLYAAELEDEGYQVETAGSASAAVELLTSRDYDLVVLDIQMRGESGLQVLQEIVRDKPELPVILCTAFSCYKEDFSSWLADAYVVKSSDTGELKAEIGRVLAKRKK